MIKVDQGPGHLRIIKNKLLMRELEGFIGQFNRKRVDIAGLRFYSPVWPLTSSINELISLIFGDKLHPVSRSAAEKRALWLIGHVGFSEEFGVKEQAKAFLALANRFDEVQKAINCPSNVIRRPFFGITQDVPRTLQTEMSDIFLVLIRRSSLKSVRLIEKDVLAALKKS